MPIDIQNLYNTLTTQNFNLDQVLRYEQAPQNTQGAGPGGIGGERAGRAGARSIRRGSGRGKRNAGA